MTVFWSRGISLNIAQATAVAVVALRTKEKKTKQLAVSGAITAYMGITEPALYGINLPKISVSCGNDRWGFWWFAGRPIRIALRPVRLVSQQSYYISVMIRCAGFLEHHYRIGDCSCGECGRLCLKFQI